MFSDTGVRTGRRMNTSIRRWNRFALHPEGMQGFSHGLRRPQAKATRGQHTPPEYHPEGVADRTAAFVISSDAAREMTPCLGCALLRRTTNGQ